MNLNATAIKMNTDTRVAAIMAPIGTVSVTAVAVPLAETDMDFSKTVEPPSLVNVILMV